MSGRLGHLQRHERGVWSIWVRGMWLAGVLWDGPSAVAPLGLPVQERQLYTVFRLIVRVHEVSKPDRRQDVSLQEGGVLI